MLSNYALEISKLTQINWVNLLEYPIRHAQAFYLSQVLRSLDAKHELRTPIGRNTTARLRQQPVREAENPSLIFARSNSNTVDHSP